MRKAEVESRRCTQLRKKMKEEGLLTARGCDWEFLYVFIEHLRMMRSAEYPDDSLKFRQYVSKLIDRM